MEYASTSKGNLGVTLGAVGTGIGLLGGNNNILGGLFGNNNHCAAILAEKDAEIARLTSEKYTDVSVLGLQTKFEKIHDKMEAQTIVNDKAIAANAQEIACLQRQLDTEAKYQKEAQCLRDQIIDGKIAAVATSANCGITNLNLALANLSATVAGITKTIVPSTAVCPQPMPLLNSWTAPTTTTTTP